MRQTSKTVKPHRNTTRWMDIIDTVDWRKSGRANRRAMIVLAEFINAKGECFPSIKLIADRLMISYEGARRRLRLAEAAGLIRRFARVDKTGRRTTNGYVFTLGDKKASAHIDQNESVDRETCPDIEQAEPDSTPQEPEETNNQPSTKVKAQYPDHPRMTVTSAASWRWWRPRPGSKSGDRLAFGVWKASDDAGEVVAVFDGAIIDKITSFLARASMPLQARSVGGA